MILFQEKFATPEENLACDEALVDELDSQEAGSASVIRFWESRSLFAVLGYSKKAAPELYLDRCKSSSVPVLRRCSGGGTVLQGPGCLNYALILPIAVRDEFETITGTNRWIMEQNRRCFQELLGHEVSVQGHTDLTLGALKFSGNSQRRKRTYLLFHGALLLKFDLAMIPHLLREPEQQPEYRRQRPHTDFVSNIPIASERISSALQSWWSNALHEPITTAQPHFIEAIHRRTAQLVHEKYSRDDWNLKF